MANVKTALDQAPTSPQTGGLTFVNVSNPAAIDSQSIRRLVRSSATRHSHRDPTRKPKSRKADRRRDASRSTGAGSPPQSIQSRGSRNNSPSESETDNSRRGSEHLGTGLFNPDERSHIFNSTEQTTLRSEMETRIRMLEQSTVQPNSSYPVDAEEWFPWMLSYYRTAYLPRGIKLLQRSESEGEWFVDWFLREGLQDPALFYMQLLSACSSLVDEDQASQDHIVWLCAKVQGSINEAISDPTRTLTTGTFLAVALIALHERLYGDKTQAIEIHGKAFARMVEMLGGIEHLMIPRLAWKILLWIDALLAADDANVDPLTARLLQLWAPERFKRIEPG